MFLFTRFLVLSLLLFAAFALQSAHVFGFFGIQPNIVLLLLVVFSLLVPIFRMGIFLFFFMEAVFLLLVFALFPFWFFETLFLILLASFLFFGKKLLTGTFGIDFFISFVIVSVAFYIVLGISNASLGFVWFAFFEFIFTLLVALFFWYVLFYRSRFVQDFFQVSL
ncbi:hypothetical protein CL629_01435 [bacterium]|nr:hypothetical protein [bacterium]